jgi:hypothetical protein
MHISLLALKGAGFFTALAILIFFLKIICPLNSGCLADPFLVVLFLPFQFIAMTGILAFLPSQYEPFFILGIWALIGAIGGMVFSYRKGKGESLEITP